MWRTITVVGSKGNNYDVLKEICERHHVRRLDLHGSSSTGEDVPDAQIEVNLLVEFLPINESDYPGTFLALEHALEELFGRQVRVLRTDHIKLDILRKQLTRRRTLLYAAEGQDES